MKPSLSIIIPCRDEEKYVERCLKSVVEQDYPKEDMEVLVVDGMSKDKTREIIKENFSQYPFIRILENPDKFTPFGLNIGIREAKGEIIARMDAHATYEKDYLSKCVKYLKEREADNVGGIIKTLPGRETIMAKAIALCLSHPFGAGNSYFRIGSKEPQFVDTVFGGCYKREVFEKIGYFNEKMIRSQDLEFNLRLRGSGGKILLVPDIVSYYYAQPTLLGFLKHNFLDGIWITYPLKFGVQAFSWRHLTPLAFVTVLFLSYLIGHFSTFFRFLFYFFTIFYILVNLYASFRVSERQKDLGYIFIMPFVFAIRHFAYAAGSLLGLSKVLINLIKVVFRKPSVSEGNH